VSYLAHLAKALPLKGRISDGQHLVDDENVHSKCAATLECEAEIHAAQ
jgi:hypothetical protein